MGLESVTSTGAPPPGYTSHRDTASSIAIDEDVLLNSTDFHPTLESHNPTHTCTHIVSPSPNVHRNSSPVPSNSYYPHTFPLTSDPFNFNSPPHILSTDDLFSTNAHSSAPCCPASTDEHCQLQAHHPDSNRYHHHRRNTNPRILTYPSADYHYWDECGNEQEEEAMMNSTATILSPREDSDPAHHHHRPRPATSTTCRVAGTTKKITKPSTKHHSTPPPPPPRPTQTQPTNYVHISRKCSPSIPTPKSWGWRRNTTQSSTTTTQIPPPRLPPSSSSAITGTFIINPELHIPPSLLNAMEDPVQRFKPSSETRKKRESRRTNLKLEVENGGIDVDIRLVPSITTTTNGGQFRDTPVQTQASASTSTTAFSTVPPPPPTEALACQRRPLPSPPHPRLSTSSTPRKPAAVGQTSSSSPRPDKKTPTTIDLRIKQACYQGMQEQDLANNNKISEPIGFPLIARIVSFFSSFCKHISDG